MSLLSEQFLRNIPEVRRRNPGEIKRGLDRSAFKKNRNGRYDIFLSHRISDAEIIFGIKCVLEAFGFAVFVDWAEAPHFDRSKVSPETASFLRDVMSYSNSLVYAASDDSPNSKWMPWELGYSDALHGRVAVMPIVEYQTESDSYTGQEYLGLYPYITLTNLQSTNELELFVNTSPTRYTTFELWLRGRGFRQH